MTATPAGMTYADYLKLDQLLSAQQPLSELHDEMLATHLAKQGGIGLAAILRAYLDRVPGTGGTK